MTRVPVNISAMHKMQELTVLTIGKPTEVFHDCGKLLIKTIEDNATVVLFNSELKTPYKLVIAKMGKNVKIDCQTWCDITIQGPVVESTIYTKKGNISCAELKAKSQVTTLDGDISCLNVNDAIVRTYCGDVRTNVAKNNAELISKKGDVFVVDADESVIIETTKIETTNLIQTSSKRNCFSTFFSLFCNFADNEESPELYENYSPINRC